MSLFGGFMFLQFLVTGVSVRDGLCEVKKASSRMFGQTSGLNIHLQFCPCAFSRLPPVETHPVESKHFSVSVDPRRPSPGASRAGPDPTPPSALCVRSQADNLRALLSTEGFSSQGRTFQNTLPYPPPPTHTPHQTPTHHHHPPH